MEPLAPGPPKQVAYFVKTPTGYVKAAGTKDHAQPSKHVVMEEFGKAILRLDTWHGSPRGSTGKHGLLNTGGTEIGDGAPFFAPEVQHVPATSVTNVPCVPGGYPPARPEQDDRHAGTDSC